MGLSTFLWQQATDLEQKPKDSESELGLQV